MDEKVPFQMLIIHEILGNIITDEKWKEFHNKMTTDDLVHTIMFSRLESERSRLLKKLPELDEEIGINLTRGMVLHEGDVLYYKAGEKMFIAKLESEEMMVLNFVGKVHEDALFEAGVRLGHAIGNQHWQIKVVGKTVFVPVTLDRKVMESVMKTHNIPGVEYCFKKDDTGQLSHEKHGYSQKPSHDHNPHTH